MRLSVHSNSPLCQKTMNRVELCLFLLYNQKEISLKPKEIIMWKEFREFAMKGNAIDLAIGIVVGAAFGKIVDSLVSDILMPPLGLLLGKIDFSNIFLVLSEGTTSPAPYITLEAAKAAGAVTLNIGLFVNVLISFFIISFAVFAVVKAMNKLREEPQEEAVEKKSCPYCHSEINLEATRCPFCTSELATKAA